MKLFYLSVLFAILTTGCNSQEKVSEKIFDETTLVNKIEFVNSKFDQPKFSCGFLLDYNNDTFAITAKHLLKIIKTDDMHVLSFENIVRKWSLYPLDKKEEIVVAGKLLNENKSERLDDKSIYDDDWLVFSLETNHSKVKPVQIRTSPLIPGEKIYVTGWTRKMESGKQRTYEFEYFKTIGNRILLKEVIVPDQFGGLSGAPVVDEKGLLVGIVSNGTVDPASDKKYFSPCVLNNLISFIDKFQKEK